MRWNIENKTSVLFSRWGTGLIGIHPAFSFSLVACNCPDVMKTNHQHPDNL